MGDDNTVECPYNSSHRIKPHRIHYHKVRCQKNYPDVIIETCPHNASHSFREGLMEKHLLECPDRFAFEVRRFNERHNSDHTLFLALNPQIMEREESINSSFPDTFASAEEFWDNPGVVWQDETTTFDEAWEPIANRERSNSLRTVSEFSIARSLSVATGSPSLVSRPDACKQYVSFGRGKGFHQCNPDIRDPEVVCQNQGLEPGKSTPEPDLTLSDPDVTLPDPDVTLPDLDVTLPDPDVTLPDPGDQSELEKSNPELARPDDHEVLNGNRIELENTLGSNPRDEVRVKRSPGGEMLMQILMGRGRGRSQWMKTRSEFEN